MKEKWSPNQLSYINKKGEVIASFLCDDWDHRSNNLTSVLYDGKYGLVNHEDGKEIMPFIFGEIGFSNEGDLMRVELNGKWGFYNEDGREVIPCGKPA